MERAYTLILTSPGSGQDVTELVQSVSWSGSIRQIARELRVALAVPRDGSVQAPALDEGAGLVLQGEQGQVVFTGQLLQCTTTTQNSIVDLCALDRGRFLVGNQGWFCFRDVPVEAAAAQVCGAFGIPVGALASGGNVTRKFSGVALDKIVITLYSIVTEQTGKRYVLRFSGEGTLEVKEKPESAGLEIAQTMSVTNTWDIQKLCNSVAIYSKDGELLSRVEDSGAQTLNGRLEHIVTQTKGKDAGAEAAAWLEDNGLRQNLTVEVLDPPLGLISGEAVTLRDTGSGVSGLFWVDGDTHTWKNGQHYGKFKLNFRNVMAEGKAGSAG